MKNILLILSALAIAGAGCSPAAPARPAGTADYQVQSDDADQGTSIDSIDDAAQAAAPEQPAPAPSPTATVVSPLKVNMEAGNFFFVPAKITAKAGQTVNITFTKNEGFHTFVIDGVTKLPIKVGGTGSFTAPSTKGSYEYWCDVGSHKAMGMVGTLIVN